jgi:hypothetical protein
MVNGRPATQGEQAAENKDRSKDFSRHNCGLSILAMRRRLCSYQPQISWRVKFFCFGNLFRKRLRAAFIHILPKPLSKLSKLASMLLQVFI